ncbi:MAG: thioredoxin domain-containing protein [Chloroflexota bacterium]|nr:thioredoxin domain-containing protein [Chloroflexota bacterium]
MANRLANETSPYLLQHKDNPVDWYPWGPEALAKAREEDKPILVSIGYSACHWCHVMEHESFEDPEIAGRMNELFVNIKVDREERPDLDSLYMTAVQAMTGHGGWPLNAFLTPDGSPFYGGTYFPPEDRQGMPGFPKVLSAVADAYRGRREAVEENAEELRALLERSTRATPAPGELNPEILARAAHALSHYFDEEHGGFGGAPKFPQPAVLEFLLREWHRTGDERAEAMVRLTLDAMATGGIYDQVGGGFHRYAVDAIWLVPHFEKMLYDNAQLARIYLDSYRAFGDPLYRRIAEETLGYVAREMTDPAGGFYATQDADSEGEEGKFYVWTPEELAEILGEDADLVGRYYAVTRRGNFEGHNILHVPRPASAVAAEAGVSEEALLAAVERARPKLYAARAERVWPGRDDKVITAWNGLMLRAFAEGARVLGRPDLRQIAERNAAFLLGTLRRDGRLLRTFKDGQAKLNGYLEDYSFLIDGLLALYQTTFERRWLDEALVLAETMVAEFADEEGVGFFDTGAGHEALVARPRDLQDGATPAGNSVAADVLLRLGAMTGDDGYSRRAARLLAAMASPMAEQPIGFGRFLSALGFELATPKEVALAGERGDPALEGLADAVWARYEPNALLGFADPTDPSLGERFPFLAERPARDGKATAYVCERYACLPPVHAPDELTAQLAQGTGVTWQEV